MEHEFLGMMPHTVTVEPYVADDFHGNPTYGEAKSYACRIVGKGLSLRRREGEENTVVFDLYLDAGPDVITTEDRVTLPDDAAFIDRTPEIFSVGKYTDDNGHHHTKIQCGWMYHRQGQ